MTDAGIEAAAEAFYRAWPGFEEWWRSEACSMSDQITPLELLPPEPFRAAIVAYLRAWEPSTREWSRLYREAAVAIVREEADRISREEGRDV